MADAQAHQPGRLPNYLGSVSKLLIVIGSCCFPIVLRELGTRHAFTQRSNPVETVAPPNGDTHQVYHRLWFNGCSLTASSTVLPAAPGAVKPGLAPLADDIHEEQHERLFHVVLLDDDEHTYEYVVEMLQKLFLFSEKIAFEHAVEVDTTGRTIVITCERPQAEFARDQIQAYGSDHRMPQSKGSMSAVLVPVGNTDISS